jgi:hypothetical protein
LQNGTLHAQNYSTRSAVRGSTFNACLAADSPKAPGSKAGFGRPPKRNVWQIPACAPRGAHASVPRGSHRSQLRGNRMPPAERRSACRPRRQCGSVCLSRPLRLPEWGATALRQ